MEKSREEGLRYNSGKLRYDLVHPKAHEGLVGVLTFGSSKYEDRNWEKGMKWSSVIASLKRHLALIEKGEDYDKESGLLHVDHLQCNAHFLSAYYRDYPKGDDRRISKIGSLNIGLDIDEVICDWLGDWGDYRGVSKDVSSWYFDRDLINEFELMKKENRLDDFYMKLKPLIKPSDIPFDPKCYITSRPIDSKVTEKWLDLHGFPARPVYTCDSINTKSKIAIEQELDYFVDDGFHNFEDLNRNGICCFLMDRKHNQKFNVGYRRIKSLKELPFL